MCTLINNVNIERGSLAYEEITQSVGHYARL